MRLGITYGVGDIREPKPAEDALVVQHLDITPFGHKAGNEYLQRIHIICDVDYTLAYAPNVPDGVGIDGQLFLANGTNGWFIFGPFQHGGFSPGPLMDYETKSSVYEENSNDGPLVRGGKYPFRISSKSGVCKAATIAGKARKIALVHVFLAAGDGWYGGQRLVTLTPPF